MIHFRSVKRMCLMLLLGLAACQVTPPATAPSRTATTAPSTVLSMAVPAATVPATSLPAPTGVPTKTPATPTAGSPTTFTSDKFKLPMTLTLGPNWSVSEDYPETISIDQKQEGFEAGFNIVTNAKLFDPANRYLVPFPQDFAAWLRADPDFAVGAQQRVTVAGHDGLQIDATPTWRSTVAVGRDSHKTFLSVSLGTVWNIVSSPKKWRFILLDNVNGQRVLILLEAPADKFDAAMQQAQEILDKVTLGLPTPTVAPTLPPATPTTEPPTTFSSKKFRLPATFTFGPDFFVEDDYPELVTIAHKQEEWEFSFNIVNDAKLFDPVSHYRVPFPQDFLAWLKADADFAVGAQQRVTVADHEGLQIDVISTWRSATAKYKPFLVVPSGTTWNIWPSPERLRFILLDNVDGQRILIMMISSPNKFDAAMQEAHRILDGAVLGNRAKVADQ